MDSSAARTASQAAAAASSELTSSTAALCCSAWKAPTGLPNCSRVRMYSVAVSAQRRTVPAAAHAARATTMQRARSVRDAGQRRACRHGVVGEVEHADVGAQVGALLLLDSEATAPESRASSANHSSAPSSVRAANRIRCAAQDSQLRLRRAVEPPAGLRRVPPGQSECSGSTTTAVAPAARSAINDAAGRIGETRHGTCGHRAQQRAGQQRRRGGLDHAGHIGEGAALPADLLGQVHGVKAAGDEFLPPGRQFASRDRIEGRAGLVDRRVPGRRIG